MIPLTLGNQILPLSLLMGPRGPRRYDGLQEDAMTLILLLLGLTLPRLSSGPRLAQIQTCQWPNRCLKTEAALVQIQPCVWPNRCAVQPAKA